MNKKYYFYYNVAGRICSAVAGENITEINRAGEEIAGRVVCIPWISASDGIGEGLFLMPHDSDYFY
jgi:hypothetical protein